MREGIFLFDKSQNLIASISPEEMKENYQKLILNGLIIGIANFPYNPKVKEAFYFGARDPENENHFWLYKIVKKQKEDGLSVLHGVHILFDDLKGAVIRDKRPSDQIPSQVMGTVLEGTGWSIGVSTATRRNSGNFYYESALSSLFSAAEKWQFEFMPRITFFDGKITGKYLDLYDQMSEDYGKWFEYGDKLLDVVAEESYENLFTAFIGRGKGEEIFDGSGESTGGFGRKIKFDSVEWKKSSGNPVDKPKGQDYVEIPEATAAYGYPDGTPRMGIIDFDDIEDPLELLQVTYEYAVENSRPKLQLKSSAHWTGKVELGETVAIIRPDIGIRYKTRVFSIERDFLNAEVKSFELGDKIRHSEAQRIRAEEKKQKARDELVESRMETIIKEITGSYWGEDGYTYDLKVGNGYGLPAGIYSFDRPIDQDPTEVIYVGAGKMLISDAKDPNGEWIWKTAATSEGLYGDAIISNSVTANKLAADVGQSLDLSSNNSITLKVGEIIAEQVDYDYLVDNGFVFYGETPPDDKSRLWVDAGSMPRVIKYYDDGSSEWVALDNQLQEQMSTLTQAVNSFEMTFSTKSSLVDLEDSTKTKFDEIEKYIRFIDGKIHISEKGNPFNLIISNDRISFANDENEIAYFSGDELFVNNLRVITKITVASAEISMITDSVAGIGVIQGGS